MNSKKITNIDIYNNEIAKKSKGSYIIIDGLTPPVMGEKKIKKIHSNNIYSNKVCPAS